MTDTQPTHDFEVALSYASEDRHYVQQVAEGLRDTGVRVFYDEFAAVELWGADLYTYLDEVYRKRARFTVVFVSRSYAAKEWTAHERQSAQARAMNELGPYLLPVRLDNAELPGLRPTVAYLDATKVQPTKLVEMIRAKVGVRDGASAGRASTEHATGFPRTALERQRLLNERPSGWEYILWCSIMWSGFSELESKWFDHELRTGRRTGLTYAANQAHDFLTDQFLGRLQQLAKVPVSLLEKDRLEWAVGAPGVSGEPAKIEHFAKKFVAAYENLLDWAAEIRGADTPDDWSTYVESMAQAADSTISSLRDFLAEFVRKCTLIPEYVERGIPIDFRLTLSVDIEESVTNAILREYKRLRCAVDTE